MAGLGPASGSGGAAVNRSRNGGLRLQQGALGLQLAPAGGAAAVCSGMGDTLLYPLILWSSAPDHAVSSILLSPDLSTVYTGSTQGALFPFVLPRAHC